MADPHRCRSRRRRREHPRSWNWSIARDLVITVRPPCAVAARVPVAFRWPDRWGERPVRGTRMSEPVRTFLACSRAMFRWGVTGRRVRHRPVAGPVCRIVWWSARRGWARWCRSLTVRTPRSRWVAAHPADGGPAGCVPRKTARENPCCPCRRLHRTSRWSGKRRPYERSVKVGSYLCARGSKFSKSCARQAGARLVWTSQQR